MKFTFQNLQAKMVTLVIEPWAMTESVPPEIEFALTAQGDPFISVVSDVVRFHAEGKDQEFKC